ncbi:AMP-binding protein [Streptomyces polychromogenes]|nr:AMP-binding protein [Streptomyces polychromogenes]
MRGEEHLDEACDLGIPWPEAFAEEYRARGYWNEEVLGGLPAQPPDVRDRQAVVTTTRTLTYGGLDRAADRLAAGLRGLGLGAADRVVVQLPNDVELVVLCTALFRLRAIPVLAYPGHRGAEIVHLVNSSGAVAYVCADETAECDYRTIAKDVLAATGSLRHVLVAGDPGPFTALSEVDGEPLDLPAPRARDVALFLLSGGTSGPPKLIPRTHADYTYQLRQSSRLCGFGAATRYLCALPMGHNFALACPGVLGTLRLGGTAVLAPSADPEVCFPLVESAGVTVTSLTPPMVSRWLDAAERTAYDLRSLELLQVGEARLAPLTGARVPERFGCVLQQVYGMSEGLLNYTRLDDPLSTVLYTQGRPLAAADETRVLREDGQEAAPGEEGELFTRGPYTVRGYYRPGEGDRSPFTPEGFFRTGDVVRRTATGYFEVVGRTGDVVNRGGEKVPARELEEHLLADPRIDSAAVVGVPHPDLGEQTCACVVPQDAAKPPTLGEVRAGLTDRGVAPYKLPDRLVVLGRIPLTPVGKTDKRELREHLRKRNGQS